MSDYYSSPEWQEKRRMRLEHDGYSCKGCGITAKQLDDLGWPSLQVHHINAGPPDYKYPSFGNERLSDLLTLCSICHYGITNSVRQQRFKLDPRKQVSHVPVSAPALSTHVPSKRHDITANDLASTVWSEPIAVPQRANSRSAKYLRQGDEGGQQQAQEDRCRLG